MIRRMTEEEIVERAAERMTFEQQLISSCKRPSFWAKVIFAFVVVVAMVVFGLAL